MLKPLDTPPGFPNQAPPPEFRRRKAGPRDYLIYWLFLLGLLAAGAGALYFFTRSETEQKTLRDRVARTWSKLGLTSDAPRETAPVQLAQTRSSKAVSAIIDPNALEEQSAMTQASAGDVSPAGSAAPVGTSVHGAGFTLRVLRTVDPAAPAPSPALVRYAENLRLGAVLQGDPARALINGRTFRTGDVTDHEHGITLAAVDLERKTLLFRETSGAEIHIGY